jgi:UDP-N-acetylglucosamine acyltransferase
MPHIHPLALVASGARLADSVVVGPFCVVEDGVTVGPGTQLVAHVHLSGPMTIGARNTIHPYACLGGVAQDRKFAPGHAGPGAVIGDDNVLREHVTVHAGTDHRATTIGDRNYLMAGAHVGHDCLVGDDCTFANHTALGGHGEVGDRVNFGGGAMAQQYCRIGRIAFVGGLLGVNRDLPPFCLVHRSKSVSSLNLVGLRRAGLAASIDPLRRAFDLLFRQGLTLPEAVVRIRAELGEDPACRELVDFVAASKHGIMGYVDSRGARGAQSSRLRDS